MTHQWIEEEIEMTHQWIEEMEFKEMIYEQIEDQEQMTDQWIKEQMEKTTNVLNWSKKLPECLRRSRK